MSELKKYRFSDLYEMSSGISSTKEQAGHGSPFLSFSCVFNNYFVPETLNDLMNTSKKEQETFSVQNGDIFLTRTSEVIDELGMSSVAIKDYPNTTFSGFLKRLRPTKSNVTYPKFMAFYLQSPLFRKTMTNNAVMTLRASLNEAIFSYLTLLLPEYDEQVKAGDLLFLLNQKIELNNRINAELEAMAKTLYDYWFVQFDFPFDFAQGKFDANGKPYKTSGGKMVYNPILKREIPEGWAAKPLSSITNVSNDSLNPADTPNKAFKHFSIPVFDATNTYGIELGGTIGSNKFTVEETDLLVSKLNPWFNRVVYAMDEEDQICSTEFVVWRSLDTAIKNFLYLIATSSQFIAHCTQSATGTSNSHKRVNPTVMMRFSVPFKHEIAEILGEEIEPILKQLMVNQRENTKLAELRDWLLPMLMNGQVTVQQ